MGREFALLLAARGARVVVNDVLPDNGGPDSAAATVRAIEAAGGQAVASDLSIADADGAKSVVDLAMDTYGRIDIVINNAGNRRFKPFPELTDDDLDSLLDVHVRGAFRITRRAWPHLQRQRYGRVLNVASVDGVLIGAGETRYLALAMLAATATFVPAAIAVDSLGGGLVALWGALTLFMVARLVGMGSRYLGDRWIVTGASREP